MSSCANCGKGEEESISLKTCTACKMVKYCSAACQKAHRPQHKRECKKRAAELHDEELFRQPPPNEECPICFLTLPTLGPGKRYNACCGKVICSGCIYAGAILPNQKCPFCRAGYPKTDEDSLQMALKRVEVDDVNAIRDIGCHYAEGRCGFPRDYAKALELWHRAGKLGCASAYYEIGRFYLKGDGVRKDEKKVKQYWELAAMGGVATARNGLGLLEARSGYTDRALKHFMFAAGAGDNRSLVEIKYLYTNGRATKHDYEKALRAYQAYLEEIRSDQRDEAAAFSEEFKYYKL